jgi:hypothetical protein
MYREPVDEYKQTPVSNRGLSISIWCGLAIVALVLFSRSQSGLALTGANSIVIGCLLAGFAGAVSLFAWVLSRQGGRVRESGVWQLIEGMSTLVPPAVIAMAILPLAAEMRLWVLGLVLAVGCCGLIFLSDIEFTDGRTHKFHRREYLFDRGHGEPFLQSIDVVEPSTDLQCRRPQTRADSERLKQPADRIPPAPAVTAPVVDGQLKQQISRFIAHNGDDRVEATWHVHFDLDQKRTVVHVPFSPAFSTRPSVECSLIDGAEVTLKVAEVHPYGVRIEARRSQTDQPADLTIGFRASAKSGSKNPMGRPTAFSVEESERSTQPDTTQKVASNVDPAYSMGNPAETVRQSGDRISSTTGPHNPPGRATLDPGSNSISKAS